MYSKIGMMAGFDSVDSRKAVGALDSFASKPPSAAHHHPAAAAVQAPDATWCRFVPQRLYS
jgi:hypothetical protein